MNPYNSAQPHHLRMPLSRFLPEEMWLAWFLFLCQTEPEGATRPGMGCLWSRTLSRLRGKVAVSSILWTILSLSSPGCHSHCTAEDMPCPPHITVLMVRMDVGVGGWRWGGMSGGQGEWGDLGPSRRQCFLIMIISLLIYSWGPSCLWTPTVVGEFPVNCVCHSQDSCYYYYLN